MKRPKECMTSFDSPRTDAVYLSAKDLAARWSCSRATAERIARREGLTRIYLGSGEQRGIVRFLQREVEAFEETRKVRAAY